MQATLPTAPIQQVRLRTFRAPSADGVAMSFGSMGHRRLGLVELEFEDGTLARGETWLNYPSWGWLERHATMAEGVAPLLVGRSFPDPTAAYRLLTERLEPLGRQWGAPGPIGQAISGVDLALWTLAAERAGLPLADLIVAAGTGQRAPALALPGYASSLGPKDVATTAANCRDRGFTAAKLKLGFGHETDLANLRAARQALGKDVLLYADANQAWSLPEALEMVPELRRWDVRWIEEPVAGDRIEDLALLAERGGLPVATGENRYGLRSFAELADVPGITVVQPDLTKVGGITAALAVTRLFPTGVVAPHLYNGAWGTLATLQFATAVGSPFLEWDVRHNPLRLDLDDLLDRDGLLHRPTGPGLGLRLDPTELEPWEETDD